MAEVYPVRDSFDWKGIMAGAKHFKDNHLKYYHGKGTVTHVGGLLHNLLSKD